MIIRRAILAVGIPCDMRTAKAFAAFAEKEYCAAFPGVAVQVDVYSLVSPVSTDTHIDSNDPADLDKLRALDVGMWNRFKEQHHA